MKIQNSSVNKHKNAKKIKAIITNTKSTVSRKLQSLNN